MWFSTFPRLFLPSPGSSRRVHAVHLVHPDHPVHSPAQHAFTLIELLTVVGISLLMTALTIPALNALKNSSDVTAAAYDISGMLQVARTYAMTNNTYVYAGFEEVTSTLSSSASIQKPGIGRLAVVVAASKDGTPGYTASGTGVTGWQGTGLVQVVKLLRVENVHLPLLTSASTFPTTGNMSALVGRRNVFARFPSYELMSGTASSATPFTYPLGSGTSQAQYVFQNVIQYDPQGSARFLPSATQDTQSVPWCIEIYLQQARGTSAPPAPQPDATGKISENDVALQVDGMTGGVRIFRP